MSNIIWLTIAILIVVFFTILTILDRPSDGHRRDDRDARKAPDLNQSPDGGSANQQPAELMAGQEGGRSRRLGRFAPDQNPNGRPDGKIDRSYQ